MDAAWFTHRAGSGFFAACYTHSTSQASELTHLRIQASLVRQNPALSGAAAQLRTQGVEALQHVWADEGASRRYIYDGMLSREQAARGAVIGQYVRMAQAGEADLSGVRDESWNVSADFRSVRRDLVESMLQHMMGAGAEPVRGAHIVQII